MRLLPLFGLSVFTALPGVSAAMGAEATPQEYEGRWALTIPSGGPGWLGVSREAEGYYDAKILWGGGSVVPVASVFFEDGEIYVVRLRNVERKNADGEVVRTQQFPILLKGRLEGDRIDFEHYAPGSDGMGMKVEPFSGVRIPDLPPAPDLNKVKFGAPIELFNGEDLSGWRLTHPRHENGWSARNGVLINETPRKGEAGIWYGNLRTEQVFEDFNLTLEVNVPEKGNSGIYLRGVYEVQVMDSHGMPLDSHHMGAIYSRITPTKPAEKPAGQWQTLDITLVDRHVTVVLNGVKIIDNEPLLGCTGGALTSNEFEPGPIYLQGDHTGVSYRNIVLRPVVKE